MMRYGTKVLEKTKFCFDIQILLQIIETIFDSLTDGKPNDISHRRNSMSVFEEVNHVKPIPIIEHKTDIVIKTLSMLLHVIIYDLVPNTPLYTHFKDFIFKKEKLVFS